MTERIPVVDLSGDKAEVTRQVGDGFKEYGFITVVNHGVDAVLIRKAYQLAEAFFLLPQEVKEKYEDTSLEEPRGFSGYGKEHVKDQVVPDLKEFWHVGRERLEDGRAQNLYPGNPWPTEIPEFKEVMLTLYDQLEMVACHLLEASALYLGLEDYFMCDRVTDGNSVLRLAHYPPVPEGTNPAVFRSAPHEDIDFITLLCEATGDGLEILRKNGEWLPVPVAPGQIVVNAGDMLQNLTNGIYKSTTHRVTNNGMDRSRRLSMPFFVHPRSEVDLTPLAVCGEPRFRSLTARQYFDERLSQIGFGKKNR